MRRYWKLIVLVVVVILTIGTFYIKQSFASSYPEMKLQTKSGDEKVADNLTLRANVGKGEGHNVAVTTEGSTSREGSFISKIQGNNRDPKIVRLQQDYRSFMRDKPENPDLFAENETTLVYTDVNSDAFDSRDQRTGLSVEWLDKGGGERSTFQVQIPENNSNVNVEDVYLVDDKLKVVTRNGKSAPEAANLEMHVYTIDQATEKIDDDATVLTGSKNMDNGDWLDMHTLADNDNQGEANRLIMAKETGTVSEVDGMVEPTDSQMVYYNLQTGKQRELLLPDELQGQEIIGLHDTTLYFSEQADETVTVTAYDIDDQEQKTSHEIEISNVMRSPEAVTPMTFVDDGKFYIVSAKQQSEQDAAVIVADLKSGDKIYEGTLDINAAIEAYDIYIYDATFQHRAENED